MKTVKSSIIALLFFSIYSLLSADSTLKKATFTTEGDLISERIPGYVKEKTIHLNEDLSLFLNYSSEYRALGVDVQPGIITGVPGLEKIRAYQVTSYFGENAKANVTAFGQLAYLLYKVPEVKNYGVFVLQEGRVQLIKEIAAEEITNNTFNLAFVADLIKDGGPGKVIKKPVFFVVPSSEIEIITQLFSPKELKTITLNVKGSPFDQSADDSLSPESHYNNYGSVPQIVLYNNPEGGITVGWADGKKVHITEINERFKITRDHKVRKEMELFGGFTKDEEGNVYILYAKKNRDGNFSSNIRLVKYNSALQRESDYNLPIERDSGYDVMVPMSSATCRLAYGNKRVAVHMGKTQHKNRGDGLNHQSGILFVVNTENMELDEKHSMKWTASHSFGQHVIFDGETFVNLDLGDNFPRGFNLTKNKSARLIFSFKTKHASTPAQRGGKRIPAGQWSNDNRTYSELGGLALDSKGYVVLGSSEKSFDNEKAQDNLNESRNLFMVLVHKDFNKIPVSTYKGKSEYNVVNKKVIVSEGEDSPVISFYDFGGGIHYQQRVGVVWLTNFNNKFKENAIRPKLAKISDNKYVALYEKWSNSAYIGTQYIVFDAKGNILKASTDLGSARINRGDEVLVKDGKVIWITGSKKTKKIMVHVLDVDNS